MFWVSAVGRRSPEQVGALRSAEGRKQVELSFPVEEEQRDAFQGISRELIGPQWVTLQHHK